MNEVLSRLRQAGIRVSADTDELVLRGRPTRELVELARAHKRQLLVDLAEEQAITDFYKCPHCGVLDYEPLGGGRRRCYACGQDWTL